MKILYGVRKGHADWEEEIITEHEDQIECAKVWAEWQGYDRFRVAEINMNEKPDFVGSINMKRVDEILKGK